MRRIVHSPLSRILLRDKPAVGVAWLLTGIAAG